METKTNARIRGQIINVDPSDQAHYLQSIWVTFPVETKDFDNALKAIGAPQCYYLCQWDFDDLPFELDLGRTPDLDDVNAIASSIAGYTDEELKFFGYLYECHEDLRSWLEMGVDNLFLIPDIHNDRELGQYYYDKYDKRIMESLFPFPPTSFIDMEDYGRDIRKEQCGQYVSAGYLALPGQEIWAYLDGQKLVEVIQAALDNSMTIDEVKALLIKENPGHEITFKVTPRR